MANHVEPDPAASWLGRGISNKFFPSGQEEEGTGGSFDGYTDTVRQRYLAAMYFSLCVMAMGGFGDFTPENTLEMLASMAMTLVNYCTLLYAIAAMTTVSAALDAPTRAFQHHFTALQTYLDAHQLPDDLRDELRVFARLKYEARTEHVDVMERFSPIVRARRATGLPHRYPPPTHPTPTHSYPPTHPPWRAAPTYDPAQDPAPPLPPRDPLLLPARPLHRLVPRVALV